MRIKPDSRIISFCLRCGQQDDLRSTPKPRLSETNQLTPDALLLVCLIDSQIRQITTILEVSKRTCHSDQCLAIPCGAKQVGMCEHRLDALRVIHRAPLRERRTLQEIDKLIFADHSAVFISNAHSTDHPSVYPTRQILAASPFIRANYVLWDDSVNPPKTCPPLSRYRPMESVLTKPASGAKLFA